MDFLINALYYIVPFIVLLGILVFVHEFGHYLVAKLCGVQVSAFSIGFGKSLWERQDSSGTVWKLSLIPLGGYCQFLGDDDASSSSDNTKDLTEEEKKKTFVYQNPYKKLAIAVGGPGFNYLFAILIFTVVFACFGKMDFPPVIGEVIKGSAAEKAGILAKDRILTVDGHQVKSFQEFRQEVKMNTSGIINLEIDRAGQKIIKTVKLEMVPLNVEAKQDQKPMLGVSSLTTVDFSVTQELSLFESFKEALMETHNITIVTLRGVGQMITGSRGTEDLGGVIRIAELSGDISKSSSWIDFLIFMALLSINLGLINLFPIPLLDGGHVVIYVIEILSRRQLNEKAKEYAFKFGFVVLMALMIFATYNDFAHLFNRWFS